MKLVLQRVHHASVSVDQKIVGKIGRGAVVLIGIAKGDNEIQAEMLARKTAELRMFDDSDGKMNLSAREAGGSFLVVSQFTLYGNCTKGRRPSFDDAADPKTAEKLYLRYVEALKKHGCPVETGVFRAMMDVELTNAGPVTFILES